jgi:Zn-dependent protease
MEKLELRDIVLSAVALAIAFAIAFNGGVQNIQTLAVSAVIIAFVAVSLSFILHELAHRFLARRYGCYAEYRMWPHGLALALLLSLAGFVFAAPGAVMIHPRADLWGASQTLTRKRMGLIALAGPLTNLALAGIFFAALLANPFQQASDMFSLATYVNVWLALFNMIPLFIFDGKKVFDWDRRIWAVNFILILALFVGLNYL